MISTLKCQNLIQKPKPFDADPRLFDADPLNF